MNKKTRCKAANGFATSWDFMMFGKISICRHRSLQCIQRSWSFGPKMYGVSVSASVVDVCHVGLALYEFVEVLSCYGCPLHF